MKCQNCKADVLTLFQFCHTCGNPLHDEAQSSGERPPRPPKRKAPPTFNEFRKKLSFQRQERAAKDKTVPAKDVLLNIGVMKLVKGTLKPVKGKIMMVRVPVCIRKLELLNKGIEKHSAHDRSFDRFASYALVYPDGTEVLTLPGQPTQLFQLDKYKEDIGKPYNRITLYLVEREMLEMNREDQSDSDLDREEDSFTQTTLTDIYTSVNVSSPDEQQQCPPSRTIGESTNVNRAAIVQNLKDMFPVREEQELVAALDCTQSLEEAISFLLNESNSLNDAYASLLSTDVADHSCFNSNVHAECDFSTVSDNTTYSLDDCLQEKLKNLEEAEIKGDGCLRLDGSISGKTLF